MDSQEQSTNNETSNKSNELNNQPNHDKNNPTSLRASWNSTSGQALFVPDDMIMNQLFTDSNLNCLVRVSNKSKNNQANNEV